MKLPIVNNISHCDFNVSDLENKAELYIHLFFTINIHMPTSAPIYKFFIKTDHLWSACWLITRALCQYKECLSMYGDFHYKYKTLMILSFLYNGDFYAARTTSVYHDDVVKWKLVPRYWLFVRGIYRSPVNSPHKGQWREAFDVFFYLRPNKRLSKQWQGWWFETPWCPL